jgi:hypothetical protein
MGIPLSGETENRDSKARRGAGHAKSRAAAAGARVARGGPIR